MDSMNRLHETEKTSRILDKKQRNVDFGVFGEGPVWKEGNIYAGGFLAQPWSKPMKSKVCAGDIRRTCLTFQSGRGKTWVILYMWCEIWMNLD